jgi:hypothetical protein
MNGSYDPSRSAVQRPTGSPPCSRRWWTRTGDKSGLTDTRFAEHEHDRAGPDHAAASRRSSSGRPTNPERLAVGVGETGATDVLLSTSWERTSGEAAEISACGRLRRANVDEKDHG